MSRHHTLAFLTLCALSLLLAACGPVEFSADGKQIVFCWNVEGKTSGLYTMNTDGTGFQALPGGAGGLLARWSPDGKYILFGDTSQNLKLYDVQAQEARQVAPDGGLAFTWHADSRQFAALCAPDQGPVEIRRFSVPEGSVTSRIPLPSDIGRTSLAEMTWLRNSDEIAFIGTDANSRSRIYLAGDSGVNRLEHSADVLGMGRTPSETQLIWACKSSDLKTHLLTLYTYDPVSHTVTRVPFPAHLAPINSDPQRLPEEIEYVTFSPDGVWMAIVVEQTGSAGTKTSPAATDDAVYVARMDGSEARLVQQAEISRSEQTPELAEELLPSWSHDGKRLAIAQWGYRSASITLYNADGSGKMRLSLPLPASDTIAQAMLRYISRHHLVALTRTRRPSR